MGSMRLARCAGRKLAASAHDQHRDHHRERQRLQRPHTFYYRHQQAPGCKCGCGSYANTGHDHTQALPQDQPCNVVSARAERHSQADLGHPLPGQIRQHTVNSNRSQQQRERRKSAEQHQ
jgi:hypothetical protein